jgi:hypothetical protein
MAYEFLASFVASLGRFVHPLPLGNALAILDAKTASGCPLLSVMLPVGYAETAIWHLAPVQPVGSSLMFTLMGPPFCPASERERTGIPLETIREHVEKFPSDRPITAKEWRVLGASWRQELDERIERLKGLRDELDGCIGCGCLSLTDCPLRNANDELGGRGTGPAILDRPVNAK